jgi:hypothetical protein
MNRKLTKTERAALELMETEARKALAEADKQIRSNMAPRRNRYSGSYHAIVQAAARAEYVVNLLVRYEVALRGDRK